MEPINSLDAVTVRQLKDWLADIPDTDAFGEAREVWVMTGPTTSSPVAKIIPLNARDGSCDVLIEAR